VKQPLLAFVAGAIFAFNAYHSVRSLGHLSLASTQWLPLALLFFSCSLVQGRWREHFPWLAGNFAGPGRDLAGLLRGHLPGAGGAGLFSALQGLLLLALLATALTGLGWLLVEGSRAALAWREWHALCANFFGALLLLHTLAASAHLLNFLRD